MDTDQLIDSLVAEGAQKPLPHPMKQTVLWLTGTVLYLAALSGYNGFRDDIARKMGETPYLLESILLFGMAISAAMAAFCLCRPDSHQIPWIKYVPFGFLLLWAVSAFAGAADIDWANLFHSMTLSRFDCPWLILLLSAPPDIAMFLIVRQGATVQCCWMGSMATWSATSFGYLCMRLIEQNDNLPHLIVWHTLPILLMFMVGMMAGRYALKWK